MISSNNILPLVAAISMCWDLSHHSWEKKIENTIKHKQNLSNQAKSYAKPQLLIPKTTIKQD
jgi:spore cortex formation protein SpoVR/YcgB (stage V sporulation)